MSRGTRARRRVLERVRQRNPVHLRSRGVPETALGSYETCASAYAACAGASIGRYISSNSLSQTSGQCPSPPKFRSRALRRAPRTGACGLGDYPTIGLSQRRSKSRYTSEKSKQFGPDGAPSHVKTLITRGPPGIIIAVSSDPILPQR